MHRNTAVRAGVNKERFSVSRFTFISTTDYKIDDNANEGDFDDTHGEDLGDSSVCR